MSSDCLAKSSCGLPVLSGLPTPFPKQLCQSCLDSLVAEASQKVDGAKQVLLLAEQSLAQVLSLPLRFGELSDVRAQLHKTAFERLSLELMYRAVFAKTKFSIRHGQWVADYCPNLGLTLSDGSGTQQVRHPFTLWNVSEALLAVKP